MRSGLAPTTSSFIAGLDQKRFKLFFCSLVLIGRPVVTVVSGTCAKPILGMCESLWEPSAGAEQLSETIAQARPSAVHGGAVAGTGVGVHVLEKDRITTRTLKAPMD